MNPDITTDKNKDADLARALDGLLKAMDNARDELNRTHERAKELAGV